MTDLITEDHTMPMAASTEEIVSEEDVLMALVEHDHEFRLVPIKVIRLQAQDKKCREVEPS